MEERNMTLFKNLNMIYQAEVAMLVSIILLSTSVISLVSRFMVLIVANISMIVVFVMLIAAILSIVALVGLRNVHKDYYSAIGMLVVGVVLALFGRGEGTTAFFFETGSSIAKLLQSYLIIRATNSLLTELETEQEKTIRRGKLVWKLYLLNALVGFATGLIPVEGNFALVVVTILITLAFGVVASVFNMIYLKAGSEAFRDAIPPETV